jgi:hypothetical protein
MTPPQQPLPVTRISWERWSAVAGFGFVAYHANSGHRAKEVGASFLIAGAALALIVFTSAAQSHCAGRSRRERCSRRSPGLAVSPAQAPLVKSPQIAAMRGE